jgi:hypothetical protein
MNQAGCRSIMGTLLSIAIGLRCKDFQLIMKIFGKFNGFVGLGFGRLTEMRCPLRQGAGLAQLLVLLLEEVDLMIEVLNLGSEACDKVVGRFKLLFKFGILGMKLVVSGVEWEFSGFVENVHGNILE